jgi:hypothetical protein
MFQIPLEVDRFCRKTGLFGLAPRANVKKKPLLQEAGKVKMGENDKNWMFPLKWYYKVVLQAKITEF